MNEEYQYPAVKYLLVSSIMHEFASAKEMYLNGKECLMTDSYISHVKIKIFTLLLNSQVNSCHRARLEKADFQGFLACNDEQNHSNNQFFFAVVVVLLCVFCFVFFYFSQ